MALKSNMFKIDEIIVIKRKMFTGSLNIDDECAFKRSVLLENFGSYHILSGCDDVGSIKLFQKLC